MQGSGAEMIDSFRGRHFFLSNFYPCLVMYEGDMYPSSEHAYQAAKTLDRAIRKSIAYLPKPGEAKRAGKHLELREGWDKIKVDVMMKILCDKFTRNQDCLVRLLRTGDEELVEGNNWNDFFWGVCRGKGDNWLGKILMQIRSELISRAK